MRHKPYLAMPRGEQWYNSILQHCKRSLPNKRYVWCREQHDSVVGTHEQPLQYRLSFERQRLRSLELDMFGIERRLHRFLLGK